jgi:hypothetical protein
MLCCIRPIGGFHGRTLDLACTALDSVTAKYGLGLYCSCCLPYHTAGRGCQAVAWIPGGSLPSASRTPPLPGGSFQPDSTFPGLDCPSNCSPTGCDPPTCRRRASRDCNCCLGKHSFLGSTLYRSLSKLSRRRYCLRSFKGGKRWTLILPDGHDHKLGDLACDYVPGFRIHEAATLRKPPSPHCL